MIGSAVQAGLERTIAVTETEFFEVVDTVAAGLARELPLLIAVAVGGTAVGPESISGQGFEPFVRAVTDMAAAGIA